jgi:hypothetical protein
MTGVTSSWIDMDEVDEKSGLPLHLLLPVDKLGRGPIPAKSARMMGCWCKDGMTCTVMPPKKMTGEPMAPSVYLEHSGELLHNVHNDTECEGRPCPVHNRTNHPMRSFPQHWRSDTKMMERICPHGIGHPDPDGYVYLMRGLGVRGAAARFMHTCDGCGHGPDDDAIFDFDISEDDD